MSEYEDLPVLVGAQVTLRPVVASELRSIAARMSRDPGIAPWWTADAGKIARWLADPGSCLFAVEADGALAGIVMYAEETDPDYRSAGIDIALFEGFTDRGLGPDTLRALLRHLFEGRGHHRATIDPTATNTRAIRAYEKVGFRPVGIMRRYERGPDGVWRDGLLMDILAEELEG